MNFPGRCGEEGLQGVIKPDEALVLSCSLKGLALFVGYRGVKGGYSGREAYIHPVCPPLNICSLTGLIPCPRVVVSSEQGKALLHGLVSHLQRGDRNVKTSL